MFSICHHFSHLQILYFRFWLLSDAMVTRSILSEILGDLAVARADILHILRELSPRSIRPAGGMAAPATAAHAETADISSSTIQSLPGPVRRLLLYAAARLPLLEKNMGLAQDAYKSFRHCIGGTQHLVHYPDCTGDLPTVNEYSGECLSPVFSSYIAPWFAYRCCRCHSAICCGFKARRDSTIR